MEISLPYGHSTLVTHVPNEIEVDIIDAPQIPAAPDPFEEVHMALESLLGEVTWQDYTDAKSVAIAINDKTRPVPLHHLLPPLLERLASLRIPDESITIYVAVGTHPPMMPGEFPAILPDAILGRYRVVSHNSEDKDRLTYLGKTSRGTPIWSNRGYLQSDLKIVVGNIEPHQFAGFSGGVKSAAIGLAGLETITSNHALMTHPGSQLGVYEDNPVRQDLEEIGQKIGIQLAINAILNHNREIVKVMAGEPIAVMQMGIPPSRKTCQVGITSKFSVTVTSPGGHPKDINVYQAQKGLGHAALVTKPGGSIILVAACPEGAGSPHYEEWALGKKTYSDVIESFHKGGFRIGPHKAYQIARDASKFRFMTCTAMDHDLASTLLLNPVEDLQTAIDTALAYMEPGERVGVLPYASSTIPYIKTKTEIENNI
jgi:nickel-dependent lactate racemase